MSRYDELQAELPEEDRSSVCQLSRADETLLEDCLTAALALPLRSSWRAISSSVFARARTVATLDCESEGFDIASVLPANMRGEDEVDLVYLTWNSCVRTPLRIFRDRFPCFWYPSADEVVVVDRDQHWLLWITDFGTLLLLELDQDTPFEVG